MTLTITNLEPKQVQEQKTVEVARKIDAEEGTPEHDVLEIADYYTVLARRVHRAWRDGMLEQGREVALHRMAWESLSFQDQPLDVFIEREVACEAFRLFATLTQPSAASASARGFRWCWGSAQGRHT